MPLSDSASLFNNAVNQLLVPNATVCSSQATYIVVKQLVRNRSSVIGVLEPGLNSPSVGSNVSDDLLACKIYESCTEGIKEEMMSRSLSRLKVVPDIVDSFFYVPPAHLEDKPQKEKYTGYTDPYESSDEDQGRQSPPYGVHVNVFKFLNTPLRRLLDRIDGPLQLPTISQFAGELLRCVIALHASGVVHGDIEAGNIFITADGTIRLGDFGASARFPENSKYQCLMTPMRQAQSHLLGKQLEDASIDTVLNSSLEETAIRQRSPSTSPSRSVCSELRPAKFPYLGSIFNLPPEALPWIMMSLRNAAKNQSLRRIVNRRLADDSDSRSYSQRLQSNAKILKPRLNPSSSRLRCVFGVIQTKEASKNCESVCRAPALASSHEDCVSTESMQSIPLGVEACRETGERGGDARSSKDIDEITDITQKVTTSLLEEVSAHEANDRYTESPRTLSVEDESLDLNNDHFIDYVDVSYLLGDPTFRYNLLMSEYGGYNPTSASDVWQIGSVVLEMVLGCSALQLVSMFGEESNVWGGIAGSKDDSIAGDEETAPMRPALLIEEQLTLITSDTFVRQFIQSLQSERKLSGVCADFILLCMTPDPDQRPSAASLLRHEFISQRAKFADRDKIVTENLRSKIPYDQYLGKILQILQLIIQRHRAGDEALREIAGPADKIMQIFRNISNVLKKPSIVPGINPAPPSARDKKDLSIEFLRSTASAVAVAQLPTDEAKKAGEDRTGGWLIPNEI